MLIDMLTLLLYRSYAVHWRGRRRVIAMAVPVRIVTPFPDSAKRSNAAVIRLYGKQNALRRRSALRQYVRMSDKLAQLRQFVMSVALPRLPSDTASAYVAACGRRCPSFRPPGCACR